MQTGGAPIDLTALEEYGKRKSQRQAPQPAVWKPLFCEDSNIDGTNFTTPASTRNTSAGAPPAASPAMNTGHQPRKGPKAPADKPADTVICLLSDDEDDAPPAKRAKNDAPQAQAPRAGAAAGAAQAGGPSASVGAAPSGPSMAHAFHGQARVPGPSFGVHAGGYAGGAAGAPGPSAARAYYGQAAQPQHGQQPAPHDGGRCQQLEQQLGAAQRKLAAVEQQLQAERGHATLTSQMVNSLSVQLGIAHTQLKCKKSPKEMELQAQLNSAQQCAERARREAEYERQQHQATRTVINTLQRQVQALQAQLARVQQQQGHPQQQGRSDEPEACSVASISAEVTRALAACDSSEERSKKIKELWLRWHPDKNPGMAGLCTEIFKIIEQVSSTMK